MKSHHARGFTLIELLVVVGIIGVLIAMSIPAISSATKASKASACMSNIRQIGIAAATYATDNRTLNVPSYNMNVDGTGNYQGTVDTVIDGWAPILDRDGYMGGKRANTGTAFVCPNVVDLEGISATGQTGSYATNPDNPKGWMDWPNKRLSSSGPATGNVAVTIPAMGFHRVIRCSYWVSADNPIGTSTNPKNDTFYTVSVGFRVGASGPVARAVKADRVLVAPSRVIAFADGLYAGKHGSNRLGDTDSRIGYRHPGQPVAGFTTTETAANAAFADGHGAAINGDVFPRTVAEATASATVFITP